MNITLDKPEANRARITLTVEPEDYAEKVKRQISKTAREIQLPGFRAGKVPSGLVRNRFGPSIFWETMNELLPEQLENFIQENELVHYGSPVPAEAGFPEVDLSDWSRSYDFVYELALMPEVEIDLSQAPTFTQREITVTEEDVDRELLKLQYRNAEQEQAETVDSSHDAFLVSFVLSDVEDPTNSDTPPQVFRQLSVNTGLNPQLHQALQGVGPGDTRQVALDQLFYNEPGNALQILKWKSEEYEQRKQEQYYVQVLSIQKLKKAELGPELYKEVLKTEEEVDDATFRERIREELQKSFDQLSRNLLHREFQNWLLQTYPLDMAWDVVERLIVQQEEKLETVEQLRQAQPHLREQVQYYLLSQKLREQHPEADMPFEEFKADMKAGLKAYSQERQEAATTQAPDAPTGEELGEESGVESGVEQGPEAQAEQAETTDTPEPTAETAQAPETPTTVEELAPEVEFEEGDPGEQAEAGQPEEKLPEADDFMFDQIIDQLFQQNPDQYQQQFNQASQQKFYNWLEESGFQVEREKLELSEFEKTYWDFQADKPDIPL